jgi:hypothetical protein
MAAAAGSAGSVRPYFVRSDHGTGVVEAWSGYPLQFGGQRRFAWQDAMAAELRRALSRLPTAPGTVVGHCPALLRSDHSRLTLAWLSSPRRLWRAEDARRGWPYFTAVRGIRSVRINFLSCEVLTIGLELRGCALFIVPSTV